MTNQSDLQASIRAVTSTTHPYEGDWHALFDDASIAVGPFEGRLLAYINAQLSSSYTNINVAKQAYATAAGADSWNSLTAIATFRSLLDFDGSRYAERDAQLTGASDGTDFTAFITGRFTGNDGGDHKCFTGSPFYYLGGKSTGDKVRFRMSNSSGTILCEMLSVTSITVASGLFTAVASVDTTDVTNTAQLYLNGVSDLNLTQDLDGTIDYTVGDTGIAANVGGAGGNADGEFIFALWPANIDLSVAANLAKFYDTTNNRPVDLGDDGTAPGLGTPLIYCYGDVGGDPGVTLPNYGGGGDFNVKSGTFAAGDLLAMTPA